MLRRPKPKFLHGQPSGRVMSSDTASIWTRVSRLRCPLCSGTVRRSQRVGWRDFVAHLLGRYPFRCWACHHRFYLRRRYSD